MENVKTKIKEIDAVKMNLEFEIDNNKVNSEFESTFNKVQRDAKVTGFRQGKAPLSVIKERYDAAVKEKVIENLIRDTLYPVLKEKNVNLASAPVIEKVEMEKGLKYTAVIERHPEITAKGYKGMKLKKEIKKIDDKAIEKGLTELRKYNTRLVESKTNIAGGESLAVVDYTVWKDGKELPALKAENQMIDLSQKQLLPGLAEGLLQAKPGEMREIVTTLPESYSKKELAKQEVILKITVKSIKEKQLPEINEDFAKELGYPTVEELKNKIKQTLNKNAMDEAEEKLQKSIDDSLISSNNIIVPESLTKSHTEHLCNITAERLSRQGVGRDFMEKQKAEIEKNAKTEAERQVKLMYIVDSIGKQENIQVTGEELSIRREEIKKSNPGKEGQVEQYFQEGTDKINYQIRTEKIYKFLTENAKIREEVIK